MNTAPQHLQFFSDFCGPSPFAAVTKQVLLQNFGQTPWSIAAVNADPQAEQANVMRSAVLAASCLHATLQKRVFAALAGGTV